MALASNTITAPNYLTTALTTADLVSWYDLDSRKEVGILSSSATKKLSLPIPDEMHRELFDESRRTGIPATKLVRSALEEWLRQRRRERRREEVRRFAMKHAGTEYDLDTQLESAAAEELRDFDEGDRETR